MKFYLIIALAVQIVYSAEGLYPKMPPASQVFVADARGDDVQGRMAAMALAGLMNQDSAEVYVVSDNHHQEQLDSVNIPQISHTHLLGDQKGIRTLFQRYGSRVQKLNVYDTTQNWSFYLALMDGAQNGGIPVTEALKNTLETEFNWTGEVEDFRNRWNNRIQAYDWAIDNLLPNCDKKIIYVGNFHVRIFDYAVAAKSFIFWLYFNNDNEIAQIEKILDRGNYTVGNSLFGYANNGDEANKVVNKYGVGYQTSDFYANGSFWSSFPNKTYWQRQGEPVTPENGKVYVTFFWSDGDNLQFDQNGLYNAWKDPARGSVPMGTALTPALQELNTPLYDHFFNNQTENDELMSGPCGFQFIYTTFYDMNLYPQWLELNTEWVKDGGFRTGSLWWTTYPSDPYSAYTASTTLEGLFHNFNNIGNTPLFPDNVGLFREYITECRSTDCVYNDLKGVAGDNNIATFRAQKLIQPAFVPDGYAQIKGVVDRLNNEDPGKYVFLIPKDFVATAKVAYDIPLPEREDPPVGVINDSKGPGNYGYINPPKSLLIGGTHNTVDQTKFDVTGRRFETGVKGPKTRIYIPPKPEIIKDEKSEK